MPRSSRFLSAAAAVLLLAGCAAPHAPGSSGAASSAQPAEPAALQGTLNQVDEELTYLIVIANDSYYRFDFGDSGVDLSGFAPGDSVTVTYSGTLDPDSEEITAQLVSISKDS